MTRTSGAVAAQDMERMCAHAQPADLPMVTVDPVEIRFFSPKRMGSDGLDGRANT